MKYFKLHTNCMPVKGSKRSLICDLERKSYDFIPNALYDILTQFDGQTLGAIKETFNQEHNDIIDEYFEFLIEKEYIFYTDNIHDFPDLKLDFVTEGLISNAIIDIDEYSLHDFSKICNSLNELRCKALQIRIYTPKSIDSILEILAYTTKSVIRSIDLALNYTDELTEYNLREKLQRCHPRIAKLWIHSSPMDELIFIDDRKSTVPAYFFSKELKDCNSCGVISPFQFGVNTKTFTESQEHNTCLNRKISIDTQGNIKNCPSMSQSFGNIKNTTLVEALTHLDFKKYWNVTKDQVSICKDCEFRHICTDCRAYVENPADMYSKPLKCGYNPYTCEWEEWSTNPLKQKAIQYYEMEELTIKVD
jgi:SPASM domain peptide maturase of grasp-with-spasm system